MVGGYMSPVNDAYAKPGLAPAEHRLRMAELAVASSPLIMVDSWEVAQPGYSRTLTVMQRVQHKLEESLSGCQPAVRGGSGVYPPLPSASAAGTALSVVELVEPYKPIIYHMISASALTHVLKHPKEAPPRPSRVCDT